MTQNTDFGHRLEGKTILITGAARRIGRCIALSCAQEGAHVIIHYGQSQDDAISLADEIKGISRQVDLIQADLRFPDQVRRLAKQSISLGPLDALVNNASIFEPVDWQTTNLDNWQTTLAVNLTAPFILSQEFARSLKPNSKGRIVNILDWRALRPGPDHLPYTISKAALGALTQSLAAGLAPAISVNGLALGAILPPVHGRTPPDILKFIPARRWAEMEEVTESVLFLLSGPEYITGEIIYVDGGRHLL